MLQTKKDGNHIPVLKAKQGTSKGTKTLVATDIQWDTESPSGLPPEITIPEGMADPNEISDYLSDVAGFCHKSFRLRKKP